MVKFYLLSVVVAVDLSKAFYSVCHPLLLAKLKAYGFTDDALELMTAYLLGRRQRSIFSAENYNNRSTIGILVKSTLI